MNALGSILQPVILIPAYKPGPNLVSLVSDLVAEGVNHIVIVDDGSGLTYRPYFDRVASYSGVRICRHAINLGKGAALKTGINTILCEYPDTGAVITADADGQHHPSDILAIAKFSSEHPKALVLGVRSFSAEIPFRSRFGNEVTKFVMRAVVGQRLLDTQTGLRAIPYCLLPTLLQVAPQGYDFELDMLLKCRDKRLPILEMPVRTIYLDGNASSHFNPVLDSMRIYFVLLRFASISLCTAAIDNFLFDALFLMTGSVAVSQLIARFLAMIFNFFTVKRVVFKLHRNRWKQFVEYVGLVAISGVISFGLIHLQVTYLGLGVLQAKLVAESVLFLANFLIQRDVIFAGSEDEQERIETERQLRAAATFMPRHASRSVEVD